MTAVLWTAVLPELLAAAPACPEPTLTRALLNAARELCEKAECYRYLVANETVTTDVSTHTFASLPSGTILHRPLTLIVNEVTLEPTSPTILNEDDPQWHTRTGQPTRFFASESTLSTVRLYPIPDETYTTYGMRGFLVLKPSRSATGLEEIFFENHQRALIEGALGYVMGIPGKPWYDPSQASFHRSEFLAAIDDAKDAANYDNTPKRRTVRYGGLEYSTTNTSDY